MTLPTYDEVTRALSKTTLKMNAAQVHGLIAGIICGNPPSDNAWEDLITGARHSKETHKSLQELYATTDQQLKDFLFEFELILPIDDAPLSERAEALTLWVQGFLTGLKLTNVPIEEQKNEEVAEAINDLIEIAKMNYEDVVASEEDEQAYVELIEYVRMAIILIYQDLRAESPQTTNNSTTNLH